MEKEIEDGVTTTERVGEAEATAAAAVDVVARTTDGSTAAGGGFGG